MKWMEWILGCIYPRRCPVCDDVTALTGSSVCDKCKEKLAVADGFHCMKCGKFIPQEDDEYCEDCRSRVHDFDEGFGVFPYHGWVQKSMVRFKFHGRQEYAAFFAEWMCRGAADRIERWCPEVIVPVPMHRKKRRQRGYNQAELLAEKIGKYLEIPVRNDLVVRIENTVPQKELDPQRRRRNLQQAFAGTAEAGRYQRVLLIDDIYTTGSTADAAARKMKECGVKKVYVLTACTGIGT